jgi:hypothetical protein
VRNRMILLGLRVCDKKERTCYDVKRGHGGV